MPAPVLTGPTNQIATQGDAATFSVSATGDSPFTYQWYETTAGYLLDEGADTLIIATVLADNGNSYYCIVTDINDLSTTSDTATLTVNPASTIAPVIIGPQDQIVNAGDVVSFNVTASGSGPFTYQWYLETGGIIAGETSRALTFTTKPVDNGKGYKCVVIDVSGLVNSSRVASLEVLGTSLPGNADIDYPCCLPGVLVNSNSYKSKDRTAANDLKSGPPLFILEDDDGYEMFDVAWSYDAVQVQTFRNWYRFITTSGSRLFNIELWVDGYDGIKQTRTHECYFIGTPQYVQNGRRWNVSATLVAIEEKGTDECLLICTLIDLSGVFPGLPDPVVPLAYACEAFEESIISINPTGYWKLNDPSIDGNVGTQPLNPAVEATVGDDLAVSGGFGTCNYASMIDDCDGSSWIMQSSGMQLIVQPTMTDLSFGVSMIIDPQVAIGNIIQFRYDTILPSNIGVLTLLQSATEVRLEYGDAGSTPASISVADNYLDGDSYMLTVNFDGTTLSVFKEFLLVGTDSIAGTITPFTGEENGFINVLANSFSRFQHLVLKVGGFSGGELATMRDGFDRSHIGYTP